jgi:hypothetical protein
MAKSATAKKAAGKAKPAAARKAASPRAPSAAKSAKVAAEQAADREAAGYGPDIGAAQPAQFVQQEFGTGNAGQMGGKAQFSAKVSDMKGRLKEGGRHILITQEFQGQEPEILISGDQEEARQFFQMFRDSFAFQELAPNS